MPVHEGRPPDNAGPNVHIVASTGSQISASEMWIDGPEIRQIYSWFDQALRQEISLIAGHIKNLVGDAVYHQAWLVGHSDAHQLGESRLHQSADPLWRDGYSQGFAIGMSERADDADRRMAKKGDEL